MSIIKYLRGLWLALIGRAEVIERDVVSYIEADASALRRRIDRLKFAATIKELPMAFIDDINTLEKEIADALAAKDTANAGNVSALGAANATIADLQSQIAANEQALQALIAKYATPAPAA